ncbi:hypothetical protein ABFA07_007624 [Porites harrisoni]
MLSFLIISLLVSLVGGRLNSEFARSGSIKVSKTKELENDQTNRQFNFGESLPEEGSTICGLVSETRHYGQGENLQVELRRVNFCRITHISSLTKAKEQHNGVPCSAPQMCVANQSLFEEVFLLDGHRESTSAVSCRCIDPRRSCYRVPNIQVLNWGTTYERAVDVGLCVGSCSRGTKACHAIDTKTVSIKGPNGAHCVQKIQRCGCVRGCYRASFRQIYTSTVFDAQTNRNKTLEKVVDIGRCNGECPKRNKQQCLHW